MVLPPDHKELGREWKGPEGRSTHQRIATAEQGGLASSEELSIEDGEIYVMYGMMYNVYFCFVHTLGQSPSVGEKVDM